MNKFIANIIIALFLISMVGSAQAIEINSEQVLKNCRQLLVVTTIKPSDSNGFLQRFHKNHAGGLWLPVGPPIEVVVGKKGVSAHKHEGDMKTPEGIFSITNAFGISKSGSKLTALPYHSITPNTVCVDDFYSQYYNQIVDASKMPVVDWRSAEKMHNYKTPYQLGLLTSFNHLNKPGDGSCIFIHVWRGYDQGTSGCVAMARKNIVRIFKWLKPKDHPAILIRSLYCGVGNG